MSPQCRYLLSRYYNAGIYYCFNMTLIAVSTMQVSTISILQCRYLLLFQHDADCCLHNASIYYCFTMTLIAVSTIQVSTLSILQCRYLLLFQYDADCCLHNAGIYYLDTTMQVSTIVST